MAIPKIDKTSVSINLLVSVATVVLSAWLFLDNRFAHAGDVKDLKQIQLQQFKELKDSQEQGQRNLRKQMVSDKVFELQLKPQPNQVDKALLDRYKRELEQLK
jgi:hypothetical protein